MLRSFIDHRYRKARGLNQGLDPEVSTSEILAFVLGRVVQRFRGLCRGFRSTYIGANVRLLSRKKLRLGHGTVIGPAVTIDSLSRRGVILGSQTTIDQGAILRGSGVIRRLGEGITIGDRTAIGAFDVILGQGGVTIGDDCLLGPNVTVVSENHIFESLEIPIRDQGEARAPTRIGNNVWIGAGVTILGGAIIGNGTVIAAGAVVRGEIPAMVIAGGIPAKVLRSRGDK